MGTTATVCTFAGDALLIAQVGDSRAYLFRNGRLSQLTRDQTLKNLLVERGQLTPEEAGEFQHTNIILQALGHHGGVEVDLGWVGVSRGDVLLALLGRSVRMRDGRAPSPRRSPRTAIRAPRATC